VAPFAPGSIDLIGAVAPPLAVLKEIPLPLARLQRSVIAAGQAHASRPC
jgi:hypothetical protein